MTVISRLCVRAKPAKGHPDLKEWESANVAVFVEADGREAALARGREALRRERWELLEVQLCDTLIEERVREQGGAMLEAYEAAALTGSAVRVFPNHFAPGKGGIPAVLPLRITEAFVDRVVADVGGERLPTDDENRVVDYLIGDWLFELKDLQEDGLRQPARQKKLAGSSPGSRCPVCPSRSTPRPSTRTTGGSSSTSWAAPSSRR